MLLDRSPDTDDRSFLETAIDMLNQLKTNIERLLASKNIHKRKPGCDLFTQLWYLAALSAWVKYFIANEESLYKKSLVLQKLK